MSTWAPNTDRVVNTAWGRTRGGSPVNGLVIHHQADGAGPDSLDYMIGWNPRGSHPTYAMDDDQEATVVGIIHPDLTPSSTGYDLDRGAVTVEVANVAGAPDYRVSDAALEQLAQLVAHHAGESQRAGHPVEVNEPSRTQAGFWVGWHSQYFATACPGDFLRAHIPGIVARANEIRGGAPTPAPKPQPPAPSGTATLDVDGAYGTKSIRRTQHILGTFEDGVIDTPSPMVEELQRRLNDAGARDWDGKSLVVDGIGLASNLHQRVPAGGRWRTIWALQAYLGVGRDGVLDMGDSATIRALQTRLNEGRF